MIVYLNKSGLIPVYLSNGGKESPQNLRMNGRRMVQLAQFVRGTAVSVFDRKNQEVRITFDVLREFATISDAEVAVLTALGFTGQGDVIFRTETSPTMGRIMPNAIVEAVDARHMGIAVTYSWSILGGSISK